MRASGLIQLPRFRFRNVEKKRVLASEPPLCGLEPRGPTAAPGAAGCGRRGGPCRLPSPSWKSSGRPRLPRPRSLREPVSQVGRCPHPVQPEARLPLGNKPAPAARVSSRARSARGLKGTLWVHLALGCLLNKSFLLIFHIGCYLKPIRAPEWKGPKVLRLSFS